MIDGKNFDQPIKIFFIKYENIQKIVTGQGDDYAPGCLLDYNHFKKFYKMIALDFDPKAIQQINFAANLGRAGHTAMYCIIKEIKENVLDFSQGLWTCGECLPKFDFVLI